MKSWQWGAVGVVALVIISIAWYLISPLFIDTVVDEALPTSEEATLSGSFSGADDFHQVEGTASVLGNVLRLEEFSSTNGPDLYVYLSTDTEATEFVNVGRLKGNIGNQNYDIPPGIDLEKYDHVLIWCQQFGVLFGTAVLS